MKDPLARIDLNLMVTFQVLMQERNVTRAAERLFVTQPAMSKTLNRLRQAIGDELFVRSPHGLTPTPRALELIDPINDILNHITDVIIDHAEFEPSTSEATISIATLGTSSSTGFPGFINKIRKLAPHLFILSQNLDKEYLERLRSGSLDFAIVAKSELPASEFISYHLMDIVPYIYMRKDHPLADKEVISREDRRKYQNIAVYFPNFETTEEEIGQLFASFGIDSRVPFLTSNIMIAIDTLNQSDMLMIASARLAESTIMSQHFVAKPLDDDIHLKVNSMSLVQHVRTKNSALHQFLVKLIVESFQEKPEAEQTFSLNNKELHDEAP